MEQPNEDSKEGERDLSIAHPHNTPGFYDALNSTAVPIKAEVRGLLHSYGKKSKSFKSLTSVAPTHEFS